MQFSLTRAAHAPLESPTAGPGPLSKLTLARALRLHWPEYLMEAAGLGFFMISACLFAVLYENPASPVRQSIGSTFLRRMLMGLAMGLTSIAIVYSPWGRQSGAHINPSVTLTFFRLRKIPKWDAIFYALSHFIGAAGGVAFAALLLGSSVSDPAVRFVATLPGETGVAAALTSEFVITFVLMFVVLQASNHGRYARFTGVFVGTLVATYITVEAPFSGMSMNPARSFGSALFADAFSSLWIYFTAPSLGMLAAAEVYLRWKGSFAVKCCKLHHDNSKRCIFCGANGGMVA